MGRVGEYATVTNSDPDLPSYHDSVPKPDADLESADAPAPTRQSRLRRFIVAFILSFLLVSWMFAPALEHYCRRHGHHGHHGHRGHHGSVEQRAQHILTHSPLIDGHNDLPFAIRVLYSNHIYQDNFTVPFEQGDMFGQVDLHRLRKGMSGGAFWSVFAPCPEDGADFSNENYGPSVQTTLQQIDLVNRLKARYPTDFSPSVDSKTAALAFDLGQLISPLGVEGLHQIGNSPANLRTFHSRGVRYATLTHNCHNKFADAALLENPMRKAEPKWGGVSPEGRKLVREMNRIGMIVDLAHASEDTMVDVLGGNDDWIGSEAPIMFSHSSAYSICPHPRNAKDYVLDLVKKRNSVIMVNFSPDFISCVESKDRDDGLPEPYPANATLAQVVKHITYIGERVGFDHVGLGSDFDGILSTPEGLEDVSKFPDLVVELLNQGVSDEDVAKIIGGNILRVWRDVDETATRLQATGEPILEDNIPPFKMPELVA
jgi:membrane dipeptidase